MKTFLRLPFLFLLMPTLSPAQSPEDIQKRVESLTQQGNSREAADLGKKSLLTPAATGRLMELTRNALNQLQAFQEQEEVIEATVKAHPQNWEVLVTGSSFYLNLPHYGSITDGKFQRSNRRWGYGTGTIVQTQLRDRVRALQLAEQSLKALPHEATDVSKARVLGALQNALIYNQRSAGQAWSLQYLTPIAELPDYDDQSGLTNPASGYPVDAEGNPIYFKASESWESAQNDGQRMLWLIQQRGLLGGAYKIGSQQELAQLAKSWFSVRNLARFGIRPSVDDEGSNRSNISSVHTLKDEESILALATGPKRLPLPPEWQFMTLYRAIAEDESQTPAFRVSAWLQIADELNDRRQYPRAVEVLQKALALEENKKGKENIQARIDSILQAQGRFDPLPPQAAGSEAKLSLTFRNAKKISLKAREVNVAKLIADAEAYLRSSPKNLDWGKANIHQIGQRLLDENNKKYLINDPIVWEQELTPRENHWDRRVDVPTPLKKAGAWLIEGSFGGDYTTRSLLWLQSITLVESKLGTGSHYYVADTVTGAPVVGATVRFFGYNQEWKDRRGRDNVLVFKFKDFQLTTDAQGQVKTKGEEMSNFQWLIQAKTTDESLTFLGFQHLYYSDHRDIFEEQSRLYSITDRPVYRPGQEVKWKAWAREVGYDPKLNTNAYAGANIEVIIQNPMGEEIHKKIYKADDSGAIDGVLSLDKEATLGSYILNFTHERALRDDVHLGQSTFRVEEYKKPEFEVIVDAPTTPVALGDKFEIKVKANYYFGGPVKQGKVKYKVQRSAHTSRWFPVGRWDWLFGPGYGWQTQYYSWYPGSEQWCYCVPRHPWIQWQSDPPELVAEGEAPLNADGTLTIPVDTALAKELHGNEDHRYEVQAEVTDQSRRTLFGNGSVLAARKPFEVYVSLDRGYYQAGENGTITVHARTLDGRAVEATGELTLYRVTYSNEGKPSEEAVHTVALKLDEKNEHRVAERLTFARGGQYRVSAKLKDAAGHEIEGTGFTTVRGEGFAEGKDFRFDDLELVTQRDEYAPGDEVEVSINTNRENSTVALFLRPQNGVYTDPVWIKLEGKSTVHRFKLSEADQPNIFIEAYTVSNARVHQVTRQIIVPPQKRIATVELTPDSATYLPGQGSTVKILVKDQAGEPFVGKVVLTAYDKALEYISGGSNQEDIKNFFWGWKRSHYPQRVDSLKALETYLRKKGDKPMLRLGVFGDNAADGEGGMVTKADAFGGGLPSLPDGYGDVRMLRRSAAMSMDLAAVAPPPSPVAMAEMAAPAAAPAPGGLAAKMAPAQEAAGEGPQPMIRSNLADSAVWIADFTTDEKGQGEFHFNLPDNLTTWKLRSWIMGPQTQVGEASVEVITRKNLMVRLQAPRFFVEKDEVVISANVHNEMDVEQSVKALLELEGGVLEFLPNHESAQAPRSIAAHGEHRFDWRVKVTGEGEAKIRVKALAQKDSDAMEMTFPAYTHGMLKTDSWSLALRPDQASGKLIFKVPAERKPEQSRLELRYSPTLAMALVDALPYLVDYPYGCTEQTLNRFVPTVLTLGVLKDLKVDLKQVKEKLTNLNAQEIGKPEERAKRWIAKDSKKVPVFDEDEVKKMARTGLARLESMRSPDGGWGWFPGGNESSPHITAVVLHGLKSAEHAGMDVNDGLIRGAVSWLINYESEQLRRLNLPKEHDDYKSTPDNLDMLIHSVLVEYQAGEKAMRNNLYEKRNNLSRYSVALLGLTCHTLEEKDRRDMCLRNLKQFLKQDDENQTAFLDLPQGGWWWYWYEDQIETQAAFLRLLSVVEPKGETASRIAKYLLNNRRNGTYWNSTKDTAAVIEALAIFAKASGESSPKQTLEILVDGKSVKTVEITQENLFTFDNSLVIEGEDVTTGEHTVEIRKLGESPLYVSTYLTVFTQEDMIPAAGLEVKARRKFYKLIEEKPEQQVAGSRGQVVTQQGFKYRREEIASDAPIQSGDLIEIELSVDSKNDYEYILIEDMKPAGFEPVEVRSGWSYDGLPSYKEYRDEKVAFFAERLPKGTHNLRYRVKAEIPGRFSALPTKIEAMYAPELKGNSDEWKALIKE